MDVSWQGNFLAYVFQHTDSSTPGRLAVLKVLLKNGARPQEKVDCCFGCGRHCTCSQILV